MRWQTPVRSIIGVVGFPLHSWDNLSDFASEAILSEFFVPLIEGFMPLQFLLEIAATLFLLGGLTILLERAGWRVGLFTKAVVVFLTILFWLKYRIYPPVPFSIAITYLVVALAAIMLWVSSSEPYWQEFRRPIIEMLDAKTTSTQLLRGTILVLLPLILGGLVFTHMIKPIEEPMELRTVGPAPPSQFKLHGQIFFLQGAGNPFRINAAGKYDPHYMAERVYEERTGRSWERGIQTDAWRSVGDRYLAAAKEGGIIYFQECVFCHGANLNGRGIFAHAFSKPFPTNFTDPGTIAQRQESYIFWRTATGGMNLPPEGFPWISTMPRMEEHLSTDEIWKVVLFTYWHTGWVPRTWD